MAYCVNCGHELPEDVNFCPDCGTEVEVDEISAEEFFADDDEDDGVEDIEEGDEVDAKDLDMSHAYTMAIDGRTAILYRDDGTMIRRYRMRANVIQATCSGENVSIVTDDGYTTLFHWSGTMIRRIRNR